MQSTKYHVQNLGTRAGPHYLVYIYQIDILGTVLLRTLLKILHQSVLWALCITSEKMPYEFSRVNYQHVFFSKNMETHIRTAL